MKKSISGLMLSLISIPIFACHINPLGECSGRAYFLTQKFNPNTLYIFTVGQDTLLTVTTNDVVTDSVFSLPVSSGTTVTMYYSGVLIDTTASNNVYAGCGALPVTLSNLRVQNINGGIVVSFDAGVEESIDRYNVLSSHDSNNWVTVGTIKPTGAKSYSIPLSAGAVALFIPFLFLFTKKKWLSALCLVLVIGFYSCKKDLEKKQNADYNYYRIQTVDKAGVITLSNIIKYQP